ncbi:MAG: DegT/DnrJ/EryC1/StrS family aminotransferase [Anaerolineae bacterium]|nr:DegT/DnrJ/EryC1/StrS family aminotransferase [Anaerolineae bacterium]MCB9107364.1 DegT/DnrJ/EryC1/StrS family aminotransferase [Anaerolineales bacterium]
MTEKLAVEGGVPVRQKPFPHWPIWDDTEEKLLLEVLHSGDWGALTGTKVQAFERTFADFQQAKHGVCVVNGTAALELALRAVGVGPGDEVITTPYTFIATANAVTLIGAIPVFVDIEPETATIDVDQIEEAITPKTKAILPVHIAGQPANMDGILAIAQKHHLRVVEDACQSWGAEWRGQRVGALGDLGTFSFQASKNITAGEGGIIVTNDDQLADLCWSLHNVGRRKGGLWYEHVRQGGNYRMTEWQGAILLAQLERADDLARRRQQNAAYLAEALQSIPGIEPLKVDPRVTRHAWHLFIFRYKREAFGGLPRHEFIAALEAEGIPCTPGYVPLNESPAVLEGLQQLQPFRSDIPVPRACPVAERLSKDEAVWLPQNLLLGGNREINDIIEAIAKIKRCLK